MSKDFVNSLEYLNSLDPKTVDSFIILVKTTENISDKEAKGLNSVKGNIFDLALLLDNLDDKIIKQYLSLKALLKIAEGLNNDDNN